MSVSGFVATITLTRTLGQEQYGAYVVILSVLAWAAIAGNLGIQQAIRKRVSESDDRNYVAAGFAVQVGLYGAVASGLWIGRSHLNQFIGMEATWILLVMLAVNLGLGFVRTVLDGQHLVHVSSVLSPVEWTSRSMIQIALVLSGFGIAGAFAGYVVGAIVAIAIGLYFVDLPRDPPSRHDFYRLKSYAQFSWLDSIKGRTFMSMDTIILAVFVSNSLIAVYEIAWNLASLFGIFGASISQTLFPEMSKLSSAGKSTDAISGLLRESLAYSGLFIIPGLIGSALIGDVILTIYGSGYSTGYYILLILTFARLVYGYMGQFLSTVSAIDRPDLTFRINALFVVVNLGLNIVLTWRFGWYGAAAATVTSAVLGLFLGYYYANQVVDITLPIGEIAKQWFAAGVMAVVVLGGRTLVGDSLPIAVALAAIGAAVYFSALLVLSPKFRTTVEDNLPFQLPVFASE